MTLRLHLFRLVGAIAVPLLAFAAVAIFLLHERENRAVERGLEDTAQALAVALDREIAASVATLQGLGTSDHLEAGDFRGFYREATRVRAAHRVWPTVFLVDRHGREIFSLLRPFGSPVPNIANDPHFQAAIRSERPYLSDLVIGPVSGLPLVRVHVPVVAGGEKYLLVATISSERVTEILETKAMSPEVIASLLDRRGVVVARTRGSRGQVGQTVSEDFFRRTTAASEGVLTSPAYERGEYAVAFSHVPGTGFVVLVGVPLSVLARGWFGVVVAGIVATLGIALVAAKVAADRISGPILALARRAEVSARGEPFAEESSSQGTVEEVEVVRRALASAEEVALERSRERECRLTADAARREAEAANAAKDQFLAMLSHELRNPLGAIANAARVVARLHHDERGDSATAIVERQVNHLARLADDLLDVSRAAAGKIVLHRSRIDLAQVVARAVHNVLRGSATPRVDLQTQPVWVDADEVRLEQIAVNLVANAVKYTPALGRILVTVGPEGDAAVLRVEDDGAGISPDLLPHVFDLFVQGEQPLHRPHGGLGLGLTLVRRLAELHGGTVTAASEGQGKGSVFTVRFPRVAAPATASVGERTPAPLPARRILVVEDNADSRSALCQLLELEGHEVYEAENGQQALHLAQVKPVDLALIDLGLPGIDGYEVARRLRAADPARRLVLIAVTGYGQAGDRQRTAAAGFDAHLVKPVDADELLSIAARSDVARLDP